MKKVLYVVLLVMALLISSVGTAAAAPMAAGTATLTSAVYVDGKGIVFTFHVDGKLSRSELKGSVRVDGGANYGLDCVQVDDSTVKCTASQAIAGANVVVTWGGSSFWTKAPQPPLPASYCYSVWDWWDFTGNEWHDFGPHCQDEPAQPGDVIKYTVPDPGGSFESDPVEFYDVDVSDYCPSPVPYNGPAYYYPGCPEFYED